MSNYNLILTYSGYFFGCLQPCLINTKSANIDSVSIKDTWVGNISIVKYLKIRL